MLRSLSEIIGYLVYSGQSRIGKCKDVIFDDQKWTTRYIDVDTGTWLPGRRVLLSPLSLQEPNHVNQIIKTSLMAKEIEEAPNLEDDAPVSKYWEDKYYSHFGWPPYYKGGALWGPTNTPRDLLIQLKEENSPEDNQRFLRSIREVNGYKLSCKEDEFGQVSDFIVDSQNWAIRYIVVETHRWIPGEKVLISPDWVENIDWPNRQMDFNLTKREIVNSPKFNSREPINKVYELQLYDYYGRPKYWETQKLSHEQRRQEVL